VVEEVLPLLVGDFGLSLDGVEIDVVLQYAVEIVVGVFNGGERLVEHIADVGFQIFESGHQVAVFVCPRIIPAGANRDEKRLAIRQLVFQNFGQQRGIGDMGEFLLAEMFTFQIKFVRKSLDKEHPKDKLFEFRRIHLAAQDVSGSHKERFEFG
jgi:hypothetical protein